MSSWDARWPNVSLLRGVFGVGGLPVDPTVLTVGVPRSTLKRRRQQVQCSLSVRGVSVNSLTDDEGCSDWKKLSVSPSMSLESTIC